MRELREPLRLALSCDEELGCLGIRPLLAELARSIAPPQLCIVGEPTRLRVADRHKGKLALRVEVRGRACHSSHVPEGVNAVEYAARLIVALRRLAGELSTADGDERFAVPHATISTGPIRGGVSLNIVPDECAFEVEIRLLPGQDVGELERRVRALAAELAREMCAVADDAGIIVSRTTDYPGLAAAGNAPAATQVAELAGPSTSGVGAIALDFGTEAGLLAQALGDAVVVCGPGDMAQGHRPDEYLEESQLRAAVAFLDRVMASLT